MNLNLIAIGKFIQDGRKHYAMTQAELAEKLDVSPQSRRGWHPLKVTYFSVVTGYHKIVKQLTNALKREGTEIIPSLRRCFYRFSWVWEA